MLKKLECLLSTIVSTIVTHNGWIIDGHDLIEIGNFKNGDRDYQVLECKKCGHISTSWRKL